MSGASPYGKERRVALDYEAAVLCVTEELKKEGFGVLTTIDVKATLKAKIDRDFNRYVILGACSPKHAFRALSAEPGVGLLLPCNVVVRENDSGETMVGFFNPGFMAEIIANPEVQAVAGEVGKALDRVMAALPSV